MEKLKSLEEQYQGYSDKQLQMLFRLKATNEDKKILIEKILLERGVLQVATFDDNKDVKTLKNDGKPEQIIEKKVTLKSTAASEKMHKEEPKPKSKVTRKKSDDKKVPFLFELGDTVIVPMAHHNKAFGGKNFKGEIIGRDIWEGHKEYKIKCDIGDGKTKMFKKRQKTLIPANENFESVKKYLSKKIDAKTVAKNTNKTAAKNTNKTAAKNMNKTAAKNTSKVDTKNVRDTVVKNVDKV